MDEMKRIVKCKYCGGYEYYGDMHWLSGKCCCRRCYKLDYQLVHDKPYSWPDLDGPVPSEQDFLEQEDDICDNCSSYGSNQCAGCEHQHVRRSDASL